MRDYEQDFIYTCNLMRQYIKKEMPQSFASVWGLFTKQERQCKAKGIQTEDVTDIYEYAKEQLENGELYM